MFGWFRRYVRKIGIFGVEIEFHPPTEPPADKPVPTIPPHSAPATVPVPQPGTVEPVGTALPNGPAGRSELNPPARLKTEIANTIGMRLKLIPAGTFLMGSPESEAGRYANETPQHKVVITKPFYMAVFEVTQRNYAAVMGINPACFHASNGGGPDHPVERVSWYDAVEFCRKLSALPAERRLRHIYRLPTEAEWEYACRAGTTTPFHFGSSLASSQANILGHCPYKAAKGPSLKRTARVGSYNANAFGLHDMHGNIWEWCADWYGASYYAQSPEFDPPGPAAGHLRVMRGGTWCFDAKSARSANRGNMSPEKCADSVGFRVVLAVPVVES